MQVGMKNSTKAFQGVILFFTPYIPLELIQLGGDWHLDETKPLTNLKDPIIIS